MGLDPIVTSNLLLFGGQGANSEVGISLLFCELSGSSGPKPTDRAVPAEPPGSLARYIFPGPLTGSPDAASGVLESGDRVFKVHPAAPARAVAPVHSCLRGVQTQPCCRGWVLLARTAQGSAAGSTSLGSSRLCQHQALCIPRLPGGRQSEAVFLEVFHEQTQNDHTDPRVSRRELQPR